MDFAPIRSGVIGLGRSGWSSHARFLGRAEAFALTAVADAVPERRAEAESTYGCTAYPDAQALLADPRVELVVVCTPSHTHSALAVAAMAAGKHVLVEKPMATSVAEADSMLAAASRTGRVLTVFQNRRLDADFVAIQEVLAAGTLGPVHQIRRAMYTYQRRDDWQTLRELGGGLLNNWGAHIIDQALILLGGRYRDFLADLRLTVSAGDAEDHVKVVLRGEGGAPTIDVEITTACALPQPEWLVMGKYGTLTGSGRRLDLKYYAPDALPPLVVNPGPARDRRYPSENIPWQEVHRDVAPADTTGAFYARLADTIRRGEPLLVTPESVRAQIALLDAIRAAGV